MKYRLTTLIVIIFAISGFFAVEAQERRIIDVHLHALPTAAFPPDVESLVKFDRASSVEKLQRETINQLEEYNITKAVTSGPPELVSKYKQAAPDRIIKSQWIPIGLTDDSLSTYLDSLSIWYDEGRFQAIGEVLTQYSGIAPDDPVLEPLWSFAEQNGVPVGIHAGPGVPDTLSDFPTEQYRLRYGNPLKMEEVLAEHPDLKVYLMHAGYPQLNDMIALLNIYPQVYVDLAGLPLSHSRAEIHRYLEGLVRAGHADRIMFGSDQQLWPDVIEESVKIIETADFLSKEQKQDIFYDNAARFFELDSANNAH